MQGYWQEFTVLEVAYIVTVPMLSTLFLEGIMETSMYVRLLILRLDLESTKVKSGLRKIGVVLADSLTTNVVTEGILTYFSKYK